MIKTLVKFSAIAIIIGLFGVHFYAPRIITEIKNPIIQLLRNKSFQGKPESFSKDKSNGRFISFNSFDDIILKAYLTYSKLDSVKGTIILLHGIRSYKEHFIEMSNKLSNLGYNAIALDSRAHGESGGKHCTFGVKEKKDISALIDFLTDEKINNNIGIWGQSLGGAIGLQSLAYDKRIKFGIIESTFSDLKIITQDYFRYHTGIKANSFCNYLLKRAGNIADFNPNESTPAMSCKLIEQPVLLVHGTQDKRIKIKYSKINFKNIKSNDKQYIEVTGANHLNVWKTGGERYFEQVMEFIDMHSKFR